MEPIVKFDRTLVAVEVDATVHMMLELAAPPAPAVDRAPLDLVAVLDRSGSMAGEPLAAVLSATNMLARLLDSQDRLAVVVFDSTVDLVLPLAHHEPEVAAAALSQVLDGDSTNLSGGWLKALEVLAGGGRPEALRRIVVLTDGHANVGIVDPATLTGLAASAHEQGITTTTIGFGDGYDEILLAAIADAGAGNDYWCANADQAAPVFTAEFDGLASVVAQNISVEIRGTDAVTTVLVLNEFPLTFVDGGIQVALGDAYGDERRRVVAMFDIKPRAETGIVEIAELVIQWAATVGQVALHTVRFPVTIGAGTGADSAVADPEVVEHVNVLRVARARKEANEAAAHGDFPHASKLLVDAADLLARTNASPAEVAELRTDAERLGHQDWTAADTKRMHSMHRTIQKGRQTRWDGTGSTDEAQ